MRPFYFSFLLFYVCASCDIENTVTLQSVDNLSLEVDEEFNPILTVQIAFYNSSPYTLHLKSLYLDILIDDKKLAIIDEELALAIDSKSHFSVPLKVKLTLEEKGLLGKIISVLMGTHYTLACTGHAVLSFWGIPIHVPVHYAKK